MFNTSKLIDRRTRSFFTLEIKTLETGFEFVNDEDEAELLEAITFDLCATDAALQLQAFMDGFWELIRRRDMFLGYTQSEFEKLIGGVSVMNRYALSLGPCIKVICLCGLCSGMHAPHTQRKNLREIQSLICTWSGSGKLFSHGLKIVSMHYFSM